MTRAPQPFDIRSRVDGILPPASPATISRRTELDCKSGALLPIWRAASSRRNAYVGVQHTTLGCSVSIIARRAWLDMPPAGMQCAPIWHADSKAVQNPRNGPNENGNKMRSPESTRAAANTAFQHSSIHCQLAVVSSHLSGLPVVDDVWLYRVYLSRGSLRFVPHGGELCWSAMSSRLVVSGSLERSRGNFSAAGSMPAASSLFV